MKFDELSRRDFLRLSAAAGAGLTISGSASLLAAEQDAKQDLIKKNLQEDTMSYARLGSTNMLVSRLSLGGSPWNSNVALAAIEKGCNLVHGSVNYSRGNLMRQQGQAFKGRWDKVFFMLKGDVSEKNVNEGLKLLGVDHVDLILPVYRQFPPRGIDNEQIVENFEKLKKAGKVSFLGFTVHTNQDLDKIIDAGVKAGFYNAFITMYQPERAKALAPTLIKARKAGLGVMTMKTTEGIYDEIEASNKAITAALSPAGGVDTTCITLRNFTETEAFIKNVKKSENTWKKGLLTPEELRELADPDVCGACGACEQVCPQDIALQEIMRCRTYYDLAVDDCPQQHYLELAPHQTAAACKDCADCEAACPRGLPIRRHIREAAQSWG